MFWGAGVTTLVVGIATWMAVLPVCGFDASGVEHCESKWAHFLASTPNEVGDTLAGFAGVLAFVWIIVTVWLQAQELSETRREVKGQRKASEEMAKAMAAQAEVFLDEKKRRDEDKAREALDQRVSNVLTFVDNHDFAEWIYQFVDSKGFVFKGAQECIPRGISKGENDEALLRLNSSIDYNFGELVRQFSRGVVTVRPSFDTSVRKLRIMLEDLSRLNPLLSIAQQERLSGFQIDRAVAALHSLENGDYWEVTTP